MYRGDTSTTMVNVSSEKQTKDQENKMISFTETIKEAVDFLAEATKDLAAIQTNLVLEDTPEHHDLAAVVAALEQMSSEVEAHFQSLDDAEIAAERVEGPGTEILELSVEAKRVYKKLVAVDSAINRVLAKQVTFEAITTKGLIVAVVDGKRVGVIQREQDDYSGVNPKTTAYIARVEGRIGYATFDCATPDSNRGYRSITERHASPRAALAAAQRWVRETIERNDAVKLGGPIEEKGTDDSDAAKNAVHWRNDPTPTVDDDDDAGDKEPTCGCGEWPVSEYGPICPSCPETRMRLEAEETSKRYSEEAELQREIRALEKEEQEAMIATAYRSRGNAVAIVGMILGEDDDDDDDDDDVACHECGRTEGETSPDCGECGAPTPDPIEPPSYLPVPTFVQRGTLVMLYSHAVENGRQRSKATAYGTTPILGTTTVYTTGGLRSVVEIGYAEEPSPGWFRVTPEGIRYIEGYWARAAERGRAEATERQKATSPAACRRRRS